MTEDLMFTIIFIVVVIGLAFVVLWLIDYLKGKERILKDQEKRKDALYVPIITPLAGWFFNIIFKPIEKLDVYCKAHPKTEAIALLILFLAILIISLIYPKTYFCFNKLSINTNILRSVSLICFIWSVFNIKRNFKK